MNVLEQESRSAVADKTVFDPNMAFDPNQPFKVHSSEASRKASVGPKEPAVEPKDSPQDQVDPGMSDFQASLFADSILGMANNLIAVGGGFFVSIKKHPEFYELEEVIHLLDTQNQKNIERIKLDEDDKALLSPLLAKVVQSQSAKLSPEKQLAMVAASILVKKAKIVFEIHAENKLLTENILKVFRNSKKEEASVSKEPNPTSKEKVESETPEAPEMSSKESKDSPDLIQEEPRVDQEADELGIKSEEKIPVAQPANEPESSTKGNFEPELDPDPEEEDKIEMDEADKSQSEPLLPAPEEDRVGAPLPEENESKAEGPELEPGTEEQNQKEEKEEEKQVVKAPRSKRRRK